MALGRSEETVADRSPERHAKFARLSEFGVTSLEEELVKRCLTKAELAVKARLNATTITKAAAGKPLRLTSIRAILQVLRRTPPLLFSQDQAGDMA